MDTVPVPVATLAESLDAKHAPHATQRLAKGCANPRRSQSHVREEERPVFIPTPDMLNRMILVTGLESGE